MVGSALVEAVRMSLDAAGKATPATVPAVDRSGRGRSPTACAPRSGSRRYHLRAASVPAFFRSG